MGIEDRGQGFAPDIGWKLGVRRRLLVAGVRDVGRDDRAQLCRTDKRGELR